MWCVYRGICSTEMDDPVRTVLEPILDELAEGYLEIVSVQEGSRKEFFGLRDFYRLVLCYPCCNEVCGLLVMNIRKCACGTHCL